MTSPRKTPVTALSLPVTTRDVANRMALDLSADLGYRVSMAAVVSASLEIAVRHSAELRAVLARAAGDDPGGSE